MNFLFAIHFQRRSMKVQDSWFIYGVMLEILYFLKRRPAGSRAREGCGLVGGSVAAAWRSNENERQ
jgi:hypothetical protein